MKIEFFHEMIPPNTTVQQRRQNNRGGYLHAQGRIAKAVWQAVFDEHRPETPLDDEPLVLLIVLTWPHTKSSEKAAGRLGKAVVAKTTRPDGDNLLKMLKDVMQDCGYFRDDAQIFDERIVRYHGPIPGVFVELKTEGGDQSQKHIANRP